MASVDTDVARETFKASGLSYNDIDKTALNFLYAYLCEELDGTEMRINFSKGMDKCGKFDKDGGITEFYIRVDGEYYENRECISFNRDGFIGFCGWASNKEKEPVIRAFDRWCNHLFNRKKFRQLIVV